MIFFTENEVEPLDLNSGSEDNCKPVQKKVKFLVALQVVLNNSAIVSEIQLLVKKRKFYNIS